MYCKKLSLAIKSAVAQCTLCRSFISNARYTRPFSLPLFDHKLRCSREQNEIDALVSPQEAYVEADVETLAAHPSTFHAAAAAMLWAILYKDWQLLSLQQEVVRPCFVYAYSSTGSVLHRASMFVSPTPAGHSCTCTLQRLNIRPGLGARPSLSPHSRDVRGL